MDCSFRAKEHFFHVLIGQEEFSFMIACEKLAATSNFFRSKDGGKVLTLVTLPKVDPLDFNLYINWLFSGRIHVQPPEQERGHVLLEEPEYLALAKLYVLGQTLEDTPFQTTIIDAMVAKFQTSDASENWRLPGKEAITLIYDSTGEGSLARKFLVRAYGAKSTVASLDALKGNVPAIFLQNVAVTILKRLDAMSGGCPQPALSNSQHQHHPQIQPPIRKRKRSEDFSRDGSRISLFMLACRSCVKHQKGLELVWDLTMRCLFVELDGVRLQVPQKEHLVCIGKHEARVWTKANEGQALRMHITGSQSINSNGSIFLAFEDHEGLSRCFDLLQYATDYHLNTISVSSTTMTAIVRKEVMEIEEDARNQRELTATIHAETSAVQNSGLRAQTQSSVNVKAA